MAPDANFKSISYNLFKVNNNFFNSESDPDINFYNDISSHDKKGRGHCRCLILSVIDINIHFGCYS